MQLSVISFNTFNCMKLFKQTKYVNVNPGFKILDFPLKKSSVFSSNTQYFDFSLSDMVNYLLDKVAV